jgi:hypothetical protein
MADLPVVLQKAKPKTKAWLNKLRAVVEENAIVAGKNYTVTKHPGGTTLVIDFLANLPRKTKTQDPYILGSTANGSLTPEGVPPTAPDPDLSKERIDLYIFGRPTFKLDGTGTDGVQGYLTRYFTSTAISYITVFQRYLKYNADGSLERISGELLEAVTFGK